MPEVSLNQVDAVRVNAETEVCALVHLVRAAAVLETIKPDDLVPNLEYLEEEHLRGLLDALDEARRALERAMITIVDEIEERRCPTVVVTGPFAFEKN